MAWSGPKGQALATDSTAPLLARPSHPENNGRIGELHRDQAFGRFGPPCCSSSEGVVECECGSVAGSCRRVPQA